MLRFLLDRCLMTPFILLNFIRSVVLNVMCAGVTLEVNAEYFNLPYPSRIWCSALLLLSLTSHDSFVFCLFILKPDSFANWLKTVIVTSRSFLSLSNSVVSSANCRIFMTVVGWNLSIFPLHYLRVFYLFAGISTARKKTVAGIDGILVWFLV